MTPNFAQIKEVFTNVAADGRVNDAYFDVLFNERLNEPYEKKQILDIWIGKKCTQINASGWAWEKKIEEFEKLVGFVKTQQNLGNAPESAEEQLKTGFNEMINGRIENIKSALDLKSFVDLPIFLKTVKEPSATTMPYMPRNLADRLTDAALHTLTRLNKLNDTDLAEWKKMAKSISDTAHEIRLGSDLSIASRNKIVVPDVTINQGKTIKFGQPTQ